MVSTIRGMVELVFTTEHVKSLEPYIRKTADHLMDKMKARGCADGPVDLIEHFALPLPSYVSLYTLIIPPVTHRAAHDWLLKDPQPKQNR